MSALRTSITRKFVTIHEIKECYVYHTDQWMSLSVYWTSLASATLRRRLNVLSMTIFGLSRFRDHIPSSGLRESPAEADERGEIMARENWLSMTIFGFSRFREGIESSTLLEASFSSVSPSPFVCAKSEAGWAVGVSMKMEGAGDGDSVWKSCTAGCSAE